MTFSTERKLSRQNIFKKFYLQPLDGSDKENPYAGKIERVIHGVMHASRTEAWTVILAAMLAEVDSDFKNQIHDDDMLYLRLSALMHDSARRNEGSDVSEAESEENCQNLLEAIGLTQEKAYYYASLITSKELSSAAPEGSDHFRMSFLRMMLQSADALDIMRCVREFDLEKLSCWHIFQAAGQEKKLISLAKNVLDIIAAQQDLMYDCKIMLQGRCIYQRHATLASKYAEGLKSKIKEKSSDNQLDEVDVIHEVDLKKQYEHSPNCYEKIMADIKKNPFLDQYCKEIPDELPNLIWHETSTQQKRKSIRDAASTTVIKDDFFIKGLRNGLHSLEFFDGVLPDHIHHPLRRAPKRKFVVSCQIIFITLYVGHQSANLL